MIGRYTKGLANDQRWGDHGDKHRQQMLQGCEESLRQRGTIIELIDQICLT
ncbi:Uncharacterised protein [Vibrio cholerae]|nr:Uncharacterised protein [Vibrio cholerae]